VKDLELDRPVYIEELRQALGLKNTRQVDHQVATGRFPPADGYIGTRRMWRLRTVLEARERMITAESIKPPPPKPDHAKRRAGGK
jgi:hypothetical protein